MDSWIPGPESLSTCGGLKSRAAAPIRRLEYSNPAGLEAWMPGYWQDWIGLEVSGC